jgi:hypothetical protein
VASGVRGVLGAGNLCFSRREFKGETDERERVGVKLNGGDLCPRRSRLLE